MKNIFKYLIAGVAGVILVTSCSKDQLETSPTTSVSGTTMTESNDFILWLILISSGFRKLLQK